MSLLSGPTTQITVDMAGFEVSADPASVLVTYALGSCIAVIVHDPRRKVGGMIHYMLPASTAAPEKALLKPAMFADTGIPLLFETMYSHGCVKSELIVKVVGGSKLYDDQGTFDIGKRNYTMMRKMFWRVGVAIAAEDVGGSKSRTVRLDVGTGAVTIRSMGDEVLL